MSKTELPEKLRIVFEQYNVIRRPTVPPMDKLVEQLKAREMVLKLDVPKSGICQAAIAVKDGRVFTQIADDADLALALALGEALTATMPRQTGLFDEDIRELFTDDSPHPPHDATVHEAEFRSLELPETVPDGSRPPSPAEELAKAVGLEPLALADFLTEHGHIVYFDDEPGAIVMVWSGVYLEADELSAVTAAAFETDPVLTTLEAEVYRDVLSGTDPVTPDGVVLAIRACELKTKHYEELRLSARGREKADAMLGAEWFAGYWNDEANRRATQLARAQKHADRLREVLTRMAGEMAQQTETETSPDDPDAPETAPDASQDDPGMVGGLLIDPNATAPAAEPPADTHAKMVGESLRMTPDELVDLLQEHGHNVMLLPEGEVADVETGEIIDSEMVSDWTGRAINSPEEPGLSVIDGDLYRIVRAGKIPTNDFGRRQAAEAFMAKARWYDLFRQAARTNEQMALDGGNDWLASYWAKVATRRIAQVAECEGQAKQLRAIKDADAGPDVPDTTDEPAGEE